MGVTKEQINLFLSDPDYLSLVELEREQRLLFITDISETRVSAFLAWLFRPYEGHGLGDRAFRELMLSAWRCVQTGEISIDTPAPKWLLDRSFRDLLVETEYRVERPTESGRQQARSRSVDLLLISRQHKFLVAIENKFGSSTHDNQLSAYRKSLARRFQNYQRVLIYLDPNERNEPDDDHWIPLSYQWIVTLIDSHQRSGLLSDRALEALSQFRDYLSEERAASDNRDSQRDQLIDAIAARHGKVLSAFADYREAGKPQSFKSRTTSICEPLFIEYHQRQQLWDGVLEQARHVHVTSAVRRHFGDAVEVSAGPAEVYFRLKPWHRFERADATGWGPWVSAWCGRNGGKTYNVWAGVRFSEIHQDREAELRAAADKLRVDMKAPPRAAQWVRISRKEKLQAQKAADRVINELDRLDKEFQSLK